MGVQLVDHSVKYPKGILEDLLVQEDRLIVPVDFLVMEMESNCVKYNEPVILLGRPFMATTRTIIDVHSGKLYMIVLGETLQFEVFRINTMHDNVNKDDECLYVDEFVGCFDDFFMKMIDDVSVPLVACKGISVDDIDGQWFDDLLCTTEQDSYETNEACGSVLYLSQAGMSAEEQCKHNASTEAKELPSLELKVLPAHLKYAFLVENKSLPVIITSELSNEKEEKIVALLKEHKKAIGWSLHDIVGISPTMCMHRIEFINGAKPLCECQRRLNPTMQEVVKI